MARKKSKLEIVSQSLSTDSRVVVQPFREDNADDLRRYFNEDYHLNHNVNIYIAPKKGLYTGKELQKFMDGLVPELKSTEVNRFSQDIDNSPENFLTIGSLNYREVFGKEIVYIKKVCQMFDIQFANDFNFKNGKKKIERQETENYERLIQVSVYPNEEIGRNALQRYQDSLKDDSRSKDLHSILYVSLDEIRKYEPNIIQKLKSKKQTRFI